MRQHKEVISLYTKGEDWDIYSIVASFRGTIRNLFLVSFFISVFELSSVLFGAGLAGGVIRISVKTICSAAAIIFAAWYFHWLRSKALAKILKAIDGKISSSVLDKMTMIQPKSSSFFTQVFADLDVIRASLTAGGIGCMLDLPFALLYLSAMGVLLGSAFPLAIVIIVVVIAFVIVGSRIVSRHDGREKLAIMDRNEKVVDAALNMSAIKNLSLTNNVKTMWKDYQDSLATVSAKKNMVVDKINDVGSVIQFVGLVIVCAVCGAAGVGILAKIAAPILYIIVSVILSGYVNYLPDYLRFVNSTERLFQLMNAERLESKTAVIDEITSGDLKLVGVSVDDGRGNSIIKDSDLVITDGQVYQVSAKSAFDSSIILKLLIGVKEPSEGRVFFDAYDLASVNPSSIKNFIRYAPQDYFVLDGTVRENLECMGSASKSDKNYEGFLDYKAAAKLLGVDRAIEELDAGYSAVISKNTRVLSEESLKLISLARAMVGNPRVMVFDNPLLGLSKASREKFLAALLQLKDARISIFASGEPSAIDRTVIAIQGGNISVKNEKAAGDDDDSSASRARFKRIFKK